MAYGGYVFSFLLIILSKRAFASLGIVLWCLCGLSDAESAPSTVHVEVQHVPSLRLKVTLQSTVDKTVEILRHRLPWGTRHSMVIVAVPANGRCLRKVTPVENAFPLDDIMNRLTLTAKTDRKGQTINYVYDALNRMTQKNYPDSTSVEYVYDLVGKVMQVNDPTGTYGFAYDNMGRLIGTTTEYSFLTGHTFTNSYAYDAASNRTGFTAPDGSTNTYSYDTLNRLNNLTNSLTGSFGFSYDQLSRRT